MIDAQRVIRNINSEKIIAILRGIQENKIIPLVEALYTGGIRIVECTFDHTSNNCIESNSRMISLLSNHFKDNLCIGAGTVLTCAEVEATVRAGGEFIISPNSDETVIKCTRKMGAVSIPGALTPSEIVNAWKAGAHFVKLFPAGNMGVSYFKSVRTPLSHIPLLAVGGITPESIPSYIKAGASGFGISSPLLPKEAIQNGDYIVITKRAKAFVEAVHQSLE